MVPTQRQEAINGIIARLTEEDLDWFLSEECLIEFNSFLFPYAEKSSLQIGAFENPVFKKWHDEWIRRIKSKNAQLIEQKASPFIKVLNKSFRVKKADKNGSKHEIIKALVDRKKRLNPAETIDWCLLEVANDTTKGYEAVKRAFYYKGKK